MSTAAVVIDEPGRISLQPVTLVPAGPDDIIVDVIWSGISAGTEKLFFDGNMPPFPGLGYPLVPGYELVGRVSAARAETGFSVGDSVFVPGAQCYRNHRGLFGATANRVVIGAKRAIPIPEALGDEATLVSLAATAHHALTLPNAEPPDLVIGNGALGRLAVRIALALGFDAPTVWEKEPSRRTADGVTAIDAGEDDRPSYRSIIDVSGDSAILDTAIGRLTKGGTVTLAGFYREKLAFTFPFAFMREASIRVAAEFTGADIDAVLALVRSRKLSLAGIITHHAAPQDCPRAYETAFRDPACVKMVLDWRNAS